MPAWKKAMRSPRLGLQYLQLLKHFRDIPEQPFGWGKGAAGRLVEADEWMEHKGMGDEGWHLDDERREYKRRRGIATKPTLDEKFVKWQEKNKPGDKNYSKKFIKWAKKNAPEIAKTIGKLGPKTLLFGTGIGTVLSPFLDAKELAAADDPMGDILRGQAEARKRVGRSLDFNRGGQVKKYYSRGSKAKKKTKKKQNGNDIVASLYKGFK